MRVVACAPLYTPNNATMSHHSFSHSIYCDAMSLTTLAMSFTNYLFEFIKIFPHFRTVTCPSSSRNPNFISFLWVFFKVSIESNAASGSSVKPGIECVNRPPLLLSTFIYQINYCDFHFRGFIRPFAQSSQLRTLKLSAERFQKAKLTARREMLRVHI